ncbi:MAG: hypothetical protein COA79_26310, partial [Planctomycetota bacterium]
MKFVLLKKLLHPLLVSAFISLMLLFILAHFIFGSCQTSKYHYMIQNHWLPTSWSQTQTIGVGKYKNYTGVWHSYFESGNIVYRGEYVNGKQVGKHVFWWENGVKMSEKVYRDGVVVSRLDWDVSGGVRR